MAPDCKDPIEENKLLRHEIAAQKQRIEWLSRQLFGRVMPGLLSFPELGDGAFSMNDVEKDVERKNASGVFRETAAPYHVSTASSAPADLPSEDVTLELPPKECGGMSVAGFERSAAVGMRSPFVMRTIRRSMYVSNDGSGSAAAAPVPALFSDPSGGPLVFDASFVAYVADLCIAGMPFSVVSERMKRENGLEISADALRSLVLAAADMIAPVCTTLVVRTLPGWTNLRHMFEEAKAGGDWLAEDFLKKIHALFELETQAGLRADCLGGAPEDLYRERRAVRARSAVIAASFFDLCRETLAILDAGSPLAETLRYALEHESVLSGFLYDPRLELSRANPETPVADPFAVLAVCADECRMRGVSFRAWLEHALTTLKQPVPPPPETLFPG